MTICTTIGQRIKYERQIKNYSQETLAKLIGMTQDSISLWENDKRIPDTIYIIKLCKALEISADYLLGLEDDIEEKICRNKYHIGNITNNGNINMK